MPLFESQREDEVVVNLYDVFDLCTDKMVIHNGKTEDIVEQLQVTKHMFYHSVSRDVPMRKRYQIIKTREKFVWQEKELQRQEFAKNWTQLCEPFLKMGGKVK